MLSVGCPNQLFTGTPFHSLPLNIITNHQISIINEKAGEDLYGKRLTFTKVFDFKNLPRPLFLKEGRDNMMLQAPPFNREYFVDPGNDGEYEALAACPSLMAELALKTGSLRVVGPSLWRAREGFIPVSERS